MIAVCNWNESMCYCARNMCDSARTTHGYYTYLCRVAHSVLPNGMRCLHKKQKRHGTLR